MGTFEAPGGLTGYAGMVRQQPLAIYVTSDGKVQVRHIMVAVLGPTSN